MSIENRRKAVQEIVDPQKNSRTRIMICGLKCGSEGLNWNWANHVLIMYESPAIRRFQANKFAGTNGGTRACMHD